MRREEFLRELKILGVKDPLGIPEGLFGYTIARWDEALCIGCRICVEECKEEAIRFENVLDLPLLFTKELSSDTKKGRLILLLKNLAKRTPKRAISVPDPVYGFGKVEIVEERCTGCGRCQRACSSKAIRLKEVISI